MKKCSTHLWQIEAPGLICQRRRRQKRRRDSRCFVQALRGLGELKFAFSMIYQWWMVERKTVVNDRMKSATVVVSNECVCAMAVFGSNEATEVVQKRLQRLQCHCNLSSLCSRSSQLEAAMSAGKTVQMTKWNFESDGFNIVKLNADDSDEALRAPLICRLICWSFLAVSTNKLHLCSMWAPKKSIKCI